MLELTPEHVTRAFRIARWYGRHARPAVVSDLESAALEGLAKAARDFDPDVRARSGQRCEEKSSFWRFAFGRILGEMKDELRRFDHLTRDQRALVALDHEGEPTVEHDELSWIDPREPMPLDATLPRDDGEHAPAIVDLIEGPRNPIEEFELRDAFCRATAGLPARHRLVLLKRELEGYSNCELADAFEVTAGRASQLRGAALERMREQIGDAFVDAA